MKPMPVVQLVVKDQDCASEKMIMNDVCVDASG